jgi:hypothetical protein
MAAAPAAALADLIKTRREKGDLRVGSDVMASGRRFFIVVLRGALVPAFEPDAQIDLLATLKGAEIRRGKSSTMALAGER